LTRPSPDTQVGVVEVRCATTADAEAVWTVLADGWRLASWVVGAARVQAVDPGWPQVGATLTYGIGAWPLVLPGAARVTQCWPSRALALHGDAPFGGIDVQVRVDSASPGCTLVMREDVVSGPARLVPAPLRAAAIGARNAETLRRLALLAEVPSP
jgi:hypothetical protein